MFQFSGYRPLTLRSEFRRMTGGGLPHSEISGSKPVCGSPELIAAYHVLHRRPAPRHPPYALSSLTTTFTLLETILDRSCDRCPAFLTGSSVVNEPGPSALVARGTTGPASRAGGGTAVAGGPAADGGADRVRTGDLRLARAALSQLSYSPGRCRTTHPLVRTDENGGPKWI